MKRISSAALSRRLLARMPGLVLGMAIASTSLNAAYRDTYYLNDHLATTVAAIDAAGEIAALEADAFGSPTSTTHAPDRYTGKPYDLDIGAFVFPFRNYRPNEARWTSADPSGFPDGTNQHKYAPLPFVAFDPDGLKSVLWIGAYPNTAGTDNGYIAQVGQQQGSLLNDLINDDKKNPSPHYLNDDDTFEWQTTTSLGGLAGSISSWDRIYLTAHGEYDPIANQYTGYYFIGGQKYREFEIFDAIGSKLHSFIGCGSATAVGISTNALQTRNAWESSTRKFLKDLSE